MKKLVLLLVAFLISVTPMLSYASAFDNLKAIDAVPMGFTEDNMNKTVTRAEFSYMTAKLLNCGELSPVKTRFADVTEENIYSGYIEYLAGAGVLSGTEGAMFLPDSPADINMVNKILACALGYSSLAESLGGYPNGYNTIAQEIGLHKNVAVAGGYVTKEGATVMVENALLSEIPSMQMVTVDGKISVYPDSKSTKRILCDVLGYSAYTGTFTKVNYEENTAVFTVATNKYKQNENMLSVGGEYVFEAKETVNFAEFEHLPATIWVNESDEVVNVIPAKNAEVKYAYIEKINGNSKYDAKYPAANIADLVLIGGEEEYEVSEKLTVKYNGVVTGLPVELCRRFARIVLINDEVTFIESWDMQEGGLITNIGLEISYIHGDNTGYAISDILSKKNIRVFIDNKVAGYKDLRVNSVFDYYETEDSLIIVASDRIYLEKLKSYSAFTSLEIGNLLCRTDGKIYCSLDGKVFKENTNVDKLLGEEVYVYFSPNGYAKYLVNAENVPSRESFYGIVSGVQSDIFGETAEIELYKVKGAVIEKGTYTVNIKKLNTGITIDDLENNAKSLSGACLYKFDANSENEILSITKPETFSGLEKNSEVSLGYVSDYSTPYFAVGKVRVYFDAKAPITYIYKGEDGFNVESITWSTIRAKYATGATLSFYGGEIMPYPEFILMAGGSSGLYKSTVLYGIYTGYTEGINSKGEVCKIARIITNTGPKNYFLDDETIKQMEEETGGAGLVKIYTNLLYSNTANEISYDSVVCKFSDKVEKWEITETVHEDGLHEATVKAVSGNRVYFDDETAYYMTHESAYKSVLSVNDYTPGERFKSIELKEIKPGDKVYYYLVSGTIYSIILVK